MQNRNFTMSGSLRKRLDNDTIQKLVPSVFAERPFDKTSNKYSFIPTIRFVEKLKDQGWMPVNAKEQRVLTEERRGYQKHIIRFQHADNLSQQGEIVPEVVLTNSHDARSAFKLMAGLFRMICTNGLVVADAMLASVTIRHSGYTDDAVKEASDYMLEGIPRLIDGVNKFRNIQLLQTEALIFAASAAMIRWNKETEEELPIQPGELLRRRRIADGDNTLWSTFNVVQENLLKGGMRMYPKSTLGNQKNRNCYPNRGRKARAITSINEDLRVNRGLWNLTEKMRELKESGEEAYKLSI